MNKLRVCLSAWAQVRLDPQVFLDGFDLEEILVPSEPCNCLYSNLNIFYWILASLRICDFLAFGLQAVFASTFCNGLIADSASMNLNIVKAV
jgi:hypothetical protein